MIKHAKNALGMFSASILLGGCAALTSVENATVPLNVYELRALEFDQSNQTRSSQSLLIETPTASGTLATDRIVIKPSDLEVKYLPDVRWTDEAPVHFQRLLATSFTNSGRFGAVVLNDVGITPDYMLLSDLGAFHATITQDDSANVSVVIKATLTLIRDDDRAVLGTRSFSATATAGSDDPSVLLPAFDTAMQSLLNESLNWLVRLMG